METERFRERRISLSVRCALFGFLLGMTLVFPGTGIHEQGSTLDTLLAAHEASPHTGTCLPSSRNRRAGKGEKGREEERFQPFILAAANRYKVDPALVRAVIRVESSYDPVAVSGKGARGLMQLMPGTAEALGVREPFNPEQNIQGGVKYIRQLLNQFDGDLELALAAYNAGSGKVREYRGIPPFKTTQQYIAKVFRYYRHYKSL